VSVNDAFTGQCREYGQRAANQQKAIFFFRLALTLLEGEGRAAQQQAHEIGGTAVQR
jgi:hypothetical protein